MSKIFSKEYLKSLLLTLIVASFCLSSSQSFAYMSEIKILESKDIVKLTDAALSSNYLEVIIEIEASNVFHRIIVFSPREYQQYKDLLRYRYELKNELQARQLDIPAIEHYHAQ